MENGQLKFEDWVRYLFDNAVTDPAWYWNDNVEVVLSEEKFLEYGTELFLNAGNLLRPFTDGQINDGLYRLISNNVSDEIFAIKNQEIPLEIRVQFLNAIFDLNRDCFGPRCTPHLSHLDSNQTPKHVSPLNSACYMWWDIFIIYGDRKDATVEPLNRACLQVMEKSLTIPNMAVQEGALHGLGHFENHYPEICHEVIENFLAQETAIHPRLKDFAQNCLTGCIL